jgi:hypothetical protein
MHKAKQPVELLSHCHLERKAMKYGENSSCSHISMCAGVVKDFKNQSCTRLDTFYVTEKMASVVIISNTYSSVQSGLLK